MAGQVGMRGRRVVLLGSCDLGCGWLGSRDLGICGLGMIWGFKGLGFGKLGFD